MKQVLQSFRTGAIELADVPAPSAAPGTLLVRNVCSVLSVGTERTMMSLAKKSLLGKAIARPDLVRQVIDKIRTEGLSETVRQASGRLEVPVSLGYSSAGDVIDRGEGVGEIAPGDRVACSGYGYSSHAEIVRVPVGMAVPIPSSVDYAQASFVTLGAIALHAVRTARPEVGERVVVIGLGLLGLLATQILRSAGCRVLGVDLDPEQARLARRIGAVDTATGSGPVVDSRIEAFTDGQGADAVIIFAATDSNEPIEAAARAVRVRGRIIVPGLVGLDIPRKLFYEKEASLVVSQAWGPGADAAEAAAGAADHPVSLVRWSARRNMGAFLDLIARGDVDLGPLISHRFPFARVIEAYEMILEGKERFRGVVVDYPEGADRSRTIRLEDRAVRAGSPESPGGPGREAARSGSARLVPAIGVIGAGLYARGTLLPALKEVAECRLEGLAASTGVQAAHVARKYGFSYCTTDVSEVIGNPSIDLVLVLTRHGSHARYAARCLEAGQSVFVEKPLALDEAQLRDVERAYRDGSGRLFVGFNRRFAPATREAVRRLRGLAGPLSIAIRVNAGFIPPDSWVHDPVEGGGRIIGEVCHFVDLAQALSGSVPVRVWAESVRSDGRGQDSEDSVSIVLRMKDGSLATIAYVASGDKATPRERVEVFGGGATCVIDNFRKMTWSHAGRVEKWGGFFQGVDRGHGEEVRILVDCVKAGRSFPVPFEEYVATTRATFAAVESLRRQRPVDLD